MSNTIVTLYTRDGCHLCESAEAVIMELKAAYDFTFRKVDIDQNDILTEQYGLMIPVVQINGEITAFGNVNKVELEGHFL